MDQWWVETHQCLRGLWDIPVPCTLSHNDLVVRTNADLHVSFGGFCLCSRSLGRSPQPADCPCPRPSQIDFLNSVIVDLQRRNEELNSKIQRMCEAALNGNEEEINNYDRYKPQRDPVVCCGNAAGSVGCARHPPELGCWEREMESSLEFRGIEPSLLLKSGVPGRAERSSVVIHDKH